MATITPDRLPNTEAIAHFNGKVLLTTQHYAELKAYEHALAFTVAKIADKDMLTEVHKAMKQAMENGTSFSDFKKQLKPYLLARGWLGLTDSKADKQYLAHRLRTIYHTNKATAYSAGQWERIQKTKEFLPYLQYMPSLSVNRRDSHKPYYNLVRPVDDPIWTSIMPPNGFGCKCWVKQLTKTRAQKILDEQAKDGIVYDIEMEEVKHPLTGEMMAVPKGVHFSFNHNHDRLTAMLKLAEDKHGSQFTKQLKAELIANYPKVMAVHEQEQIIKAWAFGYTSIANSFSQKTLEQIHAYNLTIPEAIAIKEYTSNGFWELNQFLNGTLDKDLSDVANILRGALDKLPNYEGVLIRRTRLPKEVLENHKLYNSVTYPAFTSATYDKTDKFTDYPHRLIIKSKTSKKIDWLSSNFGELEALFTSPTRFYIENIKKGDYNKDGYEFEITLREI